MIRKIAGWLLAITFFWACTVNNEPDIYTSYSGRWKCDETSSSVGYLKPYMVTIEKNTTDTMQYFIRNFFDVGENQLIVVQIDSTTVSLIQQPTSGHILQSFSGKATPYNKLQLSYTIFDGERNVYFEALYSR